jgi:hypothetical protein
MRGTRRARGTQCELCTVVVDGPEDFVWGEGCTPYVFS